MENNHQLTTRAIDLFAPSNRFASSSRLHGRLHRYQLLLRKFWWIVCLVLAAVLVPAYLLTAGSPPTYKSRARMWLTGRLDISEGRLYTEELVDYLGTQAELLRSPTLQQRALARWEGQSTNGFSVARGSVASAGACSALRIKAWLSGLAFGRANTSNAPEKVVPFKVKVAEASKSSILELEATGTDGAATQAFLNRLMEEYFVFKKETREQASDRALTSVDSQVRQLADELKAQQEKLHDFQSSNNVVFLQEQGNSAAGYLAQLNRQIAGLRTRLRLLQRLDPDQWLDSESRRGNAASGDPVAQSSATETLAGLAGPQADLFRANQQVQLLTAKRGELSRFLRPLHPKILKLNEDIATQEKLSAISRNEILRQLASHRQALQLELTNLEAVFGEWDLKAIESSRKMADYDSLRLDLQRLQAAYDRLFGVMQTVAAGKTMGQENLGILEPASVPRQVPRLMVNMAVALLAALGLAFGCLYCLGMFDDRFASPAELSDYLRLEVLGQIPSVSLKNGKAQPGVHPLERQRFEFLESFRSVRSSLLYMRNGQRRPKTILITSSVPKEGKSTVAFYLSATMAMSNSRVLLIDADMRQSTLHRFFAPGFGPGLAEILNGEACPADAVIASSMPNLSFLRAGLASTNPGELVLSPEWSRLMEELSPQFDHVLIDSPPLLATDDSASLAPKVDGVLMVVRGSFTSARMARRALDLLRQRQVNVLGAIFNRALSSASEYHYYQHFREAYRWHPQPAEAVPELVSHSPAQDRSAA